jgi:hypothetical protein
MKRSFELQNSYISFETFIIKLIIYDVRIYLHYKNRIKKEIVAN